MKSLQAEHAAWVAVKYPDQTPEIPATGCLEEAGELVHAVLKMEQVRVWGEDSRHRLVELRAKLVDAIGDCGIYACSLCNANDWDFEEMWRYAEYSDYVNDPMKQIVGLVRKAADIADDPSNGAALHDYICELKDIAHRLGVDPDTAVRVTWEKVKLR